MSAQPIQVFNPHTTLGALFLGVVVSCILYGVTNTQTYIYLSRFPQDKLSIKATVAAIWAMETAHVICVIHAVYLWTISAYGHPEALLGRAPASLITSFLLHYLIGVVVQIFFSIRIYRLNSHPIAYFLWLTATARLVMGCYVCALGFAAPSFVALKERYQGIAIASWSSSALGDVAVTATLVGILWGKRRGEGRQVLTVAFLDKIIMWTIETGMVTSVFSLLCIIVFHLMSDNFIWLGLYTLESRLFANTLLANLNSRSILREMRAAAPAILDLGLSFPAQGTGSATPTASFSRGQVLIMQERHTITDCEVGAREGACACTNGGEEEEDGEEERKAVW